MNQRIVAIDSWRAVAILAVIIFHYFVRFAPPEQIADVYGFDYLYPGALELGRYGVQLFFVISGMVITMTLLRSGNALDFSFNRFARLYPAFIACMSFTFVFVSLFGGSSFHTTLSDYLGNLTMLAEPLGFNFVDGSYWSLVVEIKFYVYAAAAWVLFRQRFWMGLVALGLAGAVAARFNPHDADLLLLARYMPYFLAGMAAWLVLKESRRGAGACVGVTALLLYIVHAGRLTLAGHPSLFAACAVLAAIGLLIASVATNFGNPFLAWIGRLSYSLYLLHENVGVLVIAHVKRWAPDWLAIGLAVGFCLLLAWASYTLVETPAANGLKALWRRRPANGLRLGPAASRPEPIKGTRMVPPG